MKRLLSTLVFCLFFSFSLFIPIAHSVNWCEDINNKGCWGMEDSGTETDLSSNSEDLAETGGTIPQDADAKFGTYSRDIDSSDSEYLLAAEGGSTDISGADQALSIVAWIKAETFSPNNIVIAKYDSGTNQRQYAFHFLSGVTSVWLSSNGTAFVQATGGTTLNTGQWYHIAMVYNDVDTRIYVDGVLDSNGADNPDAYTSGIFDSSASFRIGSRQGSSALPYDGLIDDVAIFDKALSVADINDIMDNGLVQTGGGGGNPVNVHTTIQGEMTIQ